MKLTHPERKIIESIHSHLTYEFLQRFSLEELCDRHDISKSKLTNGFRDKYAVTIYRYHLECCMEYAHQKFKEGATVKEMASLFDYSTVGSFTRAFKKVYPKTPTTYRYTR